MLVVMCDACGKYKHLSGWLDPCEFQPRCSCPPPPPEPEQYGPPHPDAVFFKPIEITATFDTTPMDVSRTPTLKFFSSKEAATGWKDDKFSIGRKTQRKARKKK